ncbi:methylenetetrahydrofolate dehydrogenase/methenyltetrahydrofolate cyclohydrolase [Lentisphaera araneosa HTCC2155]|uniref:Bifunctional protein FolD n=1 Tax=Lentisphaera araneosa HTCC2155 TaxID=313628 RepID=A6DGQ2_9BACT|nr:bifunctional methylenetetrahydrofolate dehydrogenase/methenyltetrahydrofolate cyclohydrolase FolD [Lentisphaera araneosa]EDM29369.1 methylenetetrahydrofolate dehydrogenase/methenyltetrahydrofolate cyclohydrolase [Lentisphaera araneosa HTCC2155]
MEDKLIRGKVIADEIIAELREEVSSLKEKSGKVPGLAVVLIGEDPASQVYVNSKEKMANSLGYHSVKIVLPLDSSQEAVLAVVEELNNDPAIHGILVQSPPPPQIDEEQIILNINPQKDVDGFHPSNVGLVFTGAKDGFPPCTPWGCLELLKRSKVETKGKHAVIVGRSNIVGKPMASLMIQKGVDSTVTICHSRTADLGAEIRRADIVIAAVGIPEFITGDMVSEGTVVIDVGINRVDDETRPRGYRLCGDVDFESVAPKASLITPVPGGVGPMTIAMLMSNTLLAFKRIENIG